MDKAEYRTPNGEASFSNNPVWNGVQFLYKDTEITGDQMLTFKLITDTAGSITVNNTVVVLQKGGNDIKV